MITWKATWDGHSLAQFVNFAAWDVYIQDLLDDLAHEYGKAGVAYIKPEVKGNGRWQPSTGDTARGIDYEVDRKVDGFTLYFLGEHMSDDGKHNVADMLDVGNFDKNTAMYAPALFNGGIGLRAFPISARAGNVTQYLSVIHGMGHTSPEWPANFSEKGMKRLNDNTPNLAERHMQAFLDRLVI